MSTWNREWNIVVVVPWFRYFNNRLVYHLTYIRLISQLLWDDGAWLEEGVGAKCNHGCCWMWPWTLTVQFDGRRTVEAGTTSGRRR